MRSIEEIREDILEKKKEIENINKKIKRHKIVSRIISSTLLILWITQLFLTILICLSRH